MYTSHFGLTEAPFSITPDPRYLYMSDRHREALAHLLYGVGAGGGFVQLTGEVGTGKTTLCRCLLEQLPPEVDVALILNPRLTSAELLAAVCDELRAPYAAGTASAKVLVDALDRYLLDAHARGRRTVLIIDEAQGLAPEVLEEVRLLTNLETSREKLLQVILIGQPELVRILESPRLRQLAQRVTARYHLTPLSAEETRAYIRHRLDVAGQRELLFSDGAMRRVHRLSGGIPRLINVICDRALLGAYAQSQRRIDVGTVRRAAAEVLGAAPRRRAAVWLAWLSATALVLATLGVALSGVWRRPASSPQPGPVAVPAPAARTPAAPLPAAQVVVSTTALPGAGLSGEQPHDASGTGTGAALPLERSGIPRLADRLASLGPGADRASALAALYARWSLAWDPTRDDGSGCRLARATGLGCLAQVGTWRTLRAFALPAVLELSAPTGARAYATLVGVGRERATLELGGRSGAYPLNEIDAVWDGAFLLLWKPPPLAGPVIAPGARGRDVEWLRRRLGELDATPLPTRDRTVYDGGLRERVVAFQRGRSLVPDGIVGEETLAHLTAGLRLAGAPTLTVE